MKFLFSRQNDRQAKRILIVQTCNPNLLDHVTKDVLKEFSHAQVEVLLQRNMREWITFHEGISYFDNPEGDRKELIGKLKEARYDLVVIIVSGEPGYWKLKLLPWVIDPRAVRVYNRLAQWSGLDFFSLGRFLADILAGAMGVANPRGLTLKSALRKLAAPLVFVYLLYFLRRRRLAGSNKANRIANK